MSTFRGILAEFPDIRIDYFRHRPGFKPALACFLSHIHSDHLQGLEGFYGGPFIYCSEATKELLIRLERRAHRINFAKQVVEAHDYTYVDKKFKLKTIPLETPTMIELGNGNSIRVTLFDANHCPGAVMFLIENEEHSILYTGDIRAEPWWVEAIARHPVLVPYTMGIKRLSSIYLDTSCASKENLYQSFAPKADGIRELIEKIMKYPKDTTFHLNTWTFGYEDVWVALSATFNTKIHVDRYQHRLFRSIKEKSASGQGPYLNGFTLGNSTIEGRLTNNPDCQFHSCDRKLDCPGLQGKKVVYIVPIVARIGNIEVQEPGIGQGDLESHSELSLHSDNLRLLLNVLGSIISPKVQEFLLHASHSRGEALPLEWGTEDKIAFSLLSKVLSKAAETKELVNKGLVVDGAELKKQWDTKVEGSILGDDGTWLPTRVSFPYSRHSSYNELRHLVEKFRPLDVYPCVVDESNWSESRSIRALFGDLCSGDRFAHDEEMQLQAQLRRDSKRETAPDHNLSTSEQELSQLAHDDSQWRDSDIEDMNEQIWHEQLRARQLVTSIEAMSRRGLSPIKRLLKREASDGDAKGGGLPIREKRSRLDLEITTQQVKGKEKETEYKECKVKTEVLSDREEESKLVWSDAHVEKRTEEKENGPTGIEEEGSKEQMKPWHAIEETHLPVDLGRHWARSQFLRKASHVSSLLPDNSAWGTEVGALKERGNEDDKEYTPWDQSVGAEVRNEGIEGTHLDDQRRTGVTTKHRAQSPNKERTHEGEEPPDATVHRINSRSAYPHIPKGALSLHISGHIPLPLPLDVDEDFDLEELQEATISALQVNGRSWWDVDLKSTMHKWQYAKEREL